MATEGAPPDERVWERGWDGHARAQRLRLARLPLSDKLDWLEEAHRVVRHLTRSRRAAERACEDSHGGG